MTMKLVKKDYGVCSPDAHALCYIIYRAPAWSLITDRTEQ